MSAARRRLPLALAAVLVGACGVPPGRTSSPALPTSTASRSPAPAAPGTSSAGLASPAFSGLARIVIRSVSPSGVTWSVTERGVPEHRSPLRMPFAEAELGPASPDGMILATTGDQVLVLTISGSTLTSTVSAPMPQGQMLLPACFGGDGRPVFADAESLTLVELTDGRARPFSDVAFTLGECAPLADGRTLVAVDGGGLVADQAGGPSTQVVGVRGRHLSGGGGLVAMTDPTSELGEAIVRIGTVSKDGVLGAEIGRVAGGGAERVVNAQLSPDGRWLAVVLAIEAGADPGPDQDARLRLYRVGDDGLTRVADLALEVGAHITLLPGP
jgi:hypothetical protein